MNLTVQIVAFLAIGQPRMLLNRFGGGMFCMNKQVHCVLHKSCPCLSHDPMGLTKKMQNMAHYSSNGRHIATESEEGNFRVGARQMACWGNTTKIYRRGNTEYLKEFGFIRGKACADMMVA